jgi:8-oxo-dGTP pyrophosphatase MutT (NUDIX family)
MTISRSEGAGTIRIAAAVVVNGQGQTLLVRKRGTEAFMQAGGKLGPGETSVAALEREIGEELQCGIRNCRPLGLFRADAAHEEGLTVEAELFAVDLVGELCPAAEIDEIIWCGPGDERTLSLAPLTRDHVLPLVRSRSVEGSWAELE